MSTKLIEFFQSIFLVEIGLVMFFTIFIGIIYNTLRQPKKEIEEIAQLPIKKADIDEKVEQKVCSNCTSCNGCK